MVLMVFFVMMMTYFWGKYFNLDNDNCSYDDDFDHSSNHDGDNQKDDNKDGDYNDNNILKNRVKIKRKSYH